MAERLVVISDMWGAKKGIWATSYLVYLQQYFNISYYDSQQLANLDACVDCTDQELKDGFDHGGIETAIGQLRQKEKIPARYLTFGVGGEIVWKAILKGLPVKSLYAVSAHGLPFEGQRPNIPVRWVYGALDADKPSSAQLERMQRYVEIVQGFGHDLYTDDTIIKKIAKNLLSLVTHKTNGTTKVVQIKKPLLVS